MNRIAAAEGLWHRDREQAMPRILEVYRDLAEQCASERWGFNKHVDREEFSAAALAGLWAAARRYDPESDATFTTFCLLRVRGSIVDAERMRDWVPSKRRSAEKRGEVAPLPVMFPLNGSEGRDAFNVPARDDGEGAAAELSEELASILNAAEPSAAQVLRDALACRLDLVELGERYGITHDAAVERYRMAVRMVRGEPVQPSTPAKPKAQSATGATESLPEGRPQFPSRSAPVALAGC